MYKLIKSPLLSLLLVLLVLTACNKDKYFLDTGVHKAEYDGSILSYLKSKPVYFDSLVRVINLAGMNEIYEKENLTFFAPPSALVHKSVMRLNQYLRFNGRDTVSQLEQIKPTVWRQMLALYTFKGTNRLKDYQQIDTTSILAFPGQGYKGYGNLDEKLNKTMNIGVIFNDAAGVKYAGYRQVVLSYITDLSQPTRYLNYAQVASSDIAPNNGIIHALSIMGIGSLKLTVGGDMIYYKYPLYFGFDADDFVLLAVANGISPKK
ncbi:hypothetical protein AQ505_01385 [Pedobacter sp. PACM 27299]|uniref:hypothetical protein n=1 Tax=Pedobacter sp. PACM 27299 TaxID=1727164 RepID=UPI0007067427|nr:hypothetical protein [Pedobacter sp. PACM 27299]ALL04260.1 hypothetical protein AQ505_01385 [Pedobacter sp. PACM 27299]